MLLESIAMLAVRHPPLVTVLALTLLLLSCPAPVARAQKAPAVPEDVAFEAGVEYANPDGQHLQLNLARPKKGEGSYFCPKKM
jgi:hypothetical protein